MSEKNPTWANWGILFFVNGKEITKFYRTRIQLRASVKLQRLLNRDREILVFQIVRDEYRYFQDFLTRE